MADVKSAEKPNEKKEETKGGEDMDVEEKNLEDIIEKPNPEIVEQVDVLVAKAKSSSNVLQGIEDILYIEKKQRQAENEPNTLYAAKSLLVMVWEAKDYKVLAEQISVICKRRSQFKRVVTRLVKLAMGWLTELESDKPNLLIILEALLGITEGKIYVEVERARLTLRQSKMKEAEGDVAEASKILNELQIETFGSMKIKEKLEFLLEQQRLTMANNDLIRCGLVRNKVTDKAIRKFPVLEVKYWELSLRLFYHREKEFLEMAKGYRRLLELYNADDQEEKRLTCIANCIYTIALAEHSPNQVTFIHTLNQSLPASTIGKLLERLPRLRLMLKMFCTVELISFPKNEHELEQSAFAPLKDFRLEGIEDADQTGILNKLIRKRVLQHNLRVIARHYIEIRSQRLAALVGSPLDETEAELRDLVTSGAMWARIDRVEGIVRFFKKETPALVLNNWRRDIDKLLGYVNNVCHQIHKEQMTTKA